MFQLDKWKKIVAIVCIIAGGMFSFANCFGSFGIVKAIYGAHRGLKIGSGLLAKFIQTVLMYFPFSILYGFGFVADILLFNLVEFWTGSNPVAKSEFDFEGKLVRKFQNGNESVTLTYTEFGEKLRISVSLGDTTEEFVAFRGEEGVLYREVNGDLRRIDVSSREVGSQTILQLHENGKIASARVISSADLKSLEEKLGKDLLY